MKCPHCKKPITITARAAGNGRTRSSSARVTGRRKNPGPRIGYRAKYGRKSADFFARSDKAAESYANGLLAHKMGRKPSSLQRNGKRAPKS